jgi:hypothetical protein
VLHETLKKKKPPHAGAEGARSTAPLKLEGVCDRPPVRLGDAGTGDLAVGLRGDSDEFAGAEDIADVELHVPLSETRTIV